jgi:hypothetical protein
MKKLVVASAVLGACHHREELRPEQYGGQGYDPIAPRNGPGIDPVPAPHVVPPPMQFNVETAWLNGRQLVVHLVSDNEIAKVSVETDAGEAIEVSGPVPRLEMGRGAPQTLETPKTAPPARRFNKVTLVRDNAPSLEEKSERWFILRDLSPSEQVRIHVAPPDTANASATTILLRIPPVLGGVVDLEATPGHE